MLLYNSIFYVKYSIKKSGSATIAGIIGTRRFARTCPHFFNVFTGHIPNTSSIRVATTLSALIIHEENKKDKTELEEIFAVIQEQEHNLLVEDYGIRPTRSVMPKSTLTLGRKNLGRSRLRCENSESPNRRIGLVIVGAAGRQNWSIERHGVVLVGR